MKIFTSDIPMEINNLETRGYLKTLYLLIALTSAELFQACNSEITNHNTDKVLQLTPEQNS